MADEPMSAQRPAGEIIKLTQQRDALWRELQDAREEIAAISLATRGANANLNTTLQRSQAEALALERGLSAELTALEEKIADLNTAAQVTPANEGALQQERSTSDIRSPAGGFGTMQKNRIENEPIGSPTGTTLPSAIERPAPEIVSSQRAPATVANPRIQAFVLRLQRAQVAHLRSSKKREDERIAILTSIKKTGLLVVGCALILAGICDILSLYDLGWILSWTIPMASWFMVRRINAMMKSPERIVAATNGLQRESVILRQRVVPLLPLGERGKLLAGERIGKLSGAVSSYVSTWVRDSIITQLIELLPIIDIIPFYLGQVVKMIIDQNIEYQKAQKLMPAYDRAVKIVENLEQLEIKHLGLRLAALSGPQNFPAESVGDEAPEIEKTRPFAPPVPDIARPGSPATRVVRPVPQQSRPVATVPMRDVAVAA